LKKFPDKNDLHCFNSDFPQQLPIIRSGYLDLLQQLESGEQQEQQQHLPLQDLKTNPRTINGNPNTARCPQQVAQHCPNNPILTKYAPPTNVIKSIRPYKYWQDLLFSQFIISPLFNYFICVNTHKLNIICIYTQVF